MQVEKSELKNTMTVHRKRCLKRDKVHHSVLTLIMGDTQNQSSSSPHVRLVLCGSGETENRSDIEPLHNTIRLILINPGRIMYSVGKEHLQRDTQIVVFNDFCQSVYRVTEA